MNYIQDVFLSFLPFAKFAFFAAMIFMVCKYIFVHEFPKSITENETVKLWTGKVTRCFNIGIIVYLLMTGALAITDASNTPKNTVHDKAATTQVFIQRAENNEQADAPKVDITRPNKHTDEERQKRFDSMTDWKNRGQ